LAKVSGPLLDRIDLHIEVPAVPYKELRGQATGATSSAEIRTRVEAARDIQTRRGFYNAQIPPWQLRTLCVLTTRARRRLRWPFAA
jgi:magnesium chelatase family protein